MGRTNPAYAIPPGGLARLAHIMGCATAEQFGTWCERHGILSHKAARARWSENRVKSIYINRGTWNALEPLLPSLPHVPYDSLRSFLDTAPSAAGRNDTVPQLRPLPLPDDASLEEAADARLDILAAFAQLLDRLIRDPKKDGIEVTDLTGLATGFANWNTDPHYHWIFRKFNQYAIAYRKKFGSYTPGATRSFFVDLVKLDSPTLQRLEVVLWKHARAGIGVRVAILGPGTPSDVVGDLGIYHGTQADEFFNIERNDRREPNPLADIVERSTRQPQFNDIRDRIKWLGTCKSGSVLNVLDNGPLDEVLTELARQAGIIRQPILPDPLQMP